MKIFFFDTDRLVVDAYKAHLSDFPNVEFHYGDFKELPGLFDGIVSPANSFGYMDGGIDQAYTDYFGKGVQEKLQLHIDNLPRREMLVGEGVAVVTDHPKFRTVISAPTMRTPEIIRETANVFLAMRAVLRVSLLNAMQTIAVPGLGTGIGKMPPTRCAQQVRTAMLWEDQKIKKPESLKEHWMLERALKIYV